MVNFVKDADLPGIFRYLMEDKDENGLGYDRVRATDVAAETVLAEYRRRNPDLMAARAEKLGVPEYTLEQQLAEFYDEGYSSEQVLGFGMGLDPRQCSSPCCRILWEGRCRKCGSSSYLNGRDEGCSRRNEVALCARSI
jgi:hypothetical protein